jgi:hypothetical protein
VLGGVLLGKFAPTVLLPLIILLAMGASVSVYESETLQSTYNRTLQKCPSYSASNTMKGNTININAEIGTINLEQSLTLDNKCVFKEMRQAAIESTEKNKTDAGVALGASVSDIKSKTAQQLVDEAVMDCGAVTTNNVMEGNTVNVNYDNPFSDLNFTQAMDVKSQCALDKFSKAIASSDKDFDVQTGISGTNLALIAGGLAVVALVGGGIYLMLRSGGGGSPSSPSFSYSPQPQPYASYSQPNGNYGAPYTPTTPTMGATMSNPPSNVSTPQLNRSTPVVQQAQQAQQAQKVQQQAQKAAQMTQTSRMQSVRPQGAQRVRFGNNVPTTPTQIPASVTAPNVNTNTTTYYYPRVPTTSSMSAMSPNPGYTY